MRKTIFFLLFTLLIQTLPVCVAHGEGIPVMKEFYVSPTGNDDAEGTKQAPFKTLQRAKDEVKKINGDMQGDINVYLREGTYRQSKTLSFTKEDSGTNGYYVNYKAYPEESVSVTGSKKVEGFKKEGELFVAEVLGIDYAPQLFVNGQKAKRAESEEYYDIKDFFDIPGNEYKYDGIIAEGREFSKYENQSDIQLHFARGWKSFLLNVEGIEKSGEKSKFIMRQPGFYNAEDDDACGFYSIDPGHNFKIENAFEELDTEGEFYYNRKSKKLYYMPREGEMAETTTAELAVVEKLMEFKGDSSTEKVKNISFEDITFAHSIWERAVKVGHVGDQAQDMAPDPSDIPINPGYTMVPSNISLDRAAKINFTGCTIKDMGAVGIGLYQGVENCKFTGNVFCDLGDSAMTIGMASQAYTDEVHKGRNLAGGKAATASGYSHKNYMADKALDINKTTGWSAGGNAPYWWQVDLGEPYEIDRVEIDDRPDADQAVIRQSFEVLGSNDPEFKTYKILCAQGPRPFPHKGTGILKVETSEKFRYVRIRKNNNDYMFLTEVRIINESMDYSPVNEICKNNTIENNYITRVGNTNYGAPGIQAYFVEGLNISHNYVYDVPYSGICVGWGWSNFLDSTTCKDNKINYNKIEKTLQVNYDAGGIYVLGNQPNSIQVGNYITGTKNINGGSYLDNGSRFQTIKENVIENVPIAYVSGAYTGNNKWEDNHTNISTVDWMLTLDDNCEFEEPNMYAPGNYSIESYEIIKNAGLEDKWKHITLKAGENLWERPDEVVFNNIFKDRNNPYLADTLVITGYLRNYLTSARAWLDMITVGDGIGMYPKSAVDSLKAEIEKGDSILNKDPVSREEIINTGKEFLKAAEAFENSRISYDFDETLLLAEKELGNTMAGEGIGNVSLIDYNRLTSAIEEAKANKGNEESRKYLETALINVMNNKVNLNIKGADMEGRNGKVQIDSENSIITIPVLYSADLDEAKVNIKHHEKAIVEPGLNIAQNFNEDVTYTLKTIDGKSERKWTVRCVKPEPLNDEKTFNLKEVIKDKEAWKTFSLYNCNNYTGTLFGDVTVEFDMKINERAGDWPCLTFRSQDPGKTFEDGKNESYVFVFTPGMLEFHRFNNGVRTQFYGNVPNCTTIFGGTLATDAFKFGEKNHIKLTTKNEADGVRIILYINDEKVIDVLDNYEGAILNPGYLGTVAPNAPIELS